MTSPYVREQVPRTHEQHGLQHITTGVLPSRRRPHRQGPSPHAHAAYWSPTPAPCKSAHAGRSGPAADHAPRCGPWRPRTGTWSADPEVRLANVADRRLDQFRRVPERLVTVEYVCRSHTTISPRAGAGSDLPRGGASRGRGEIRSEFANAEDGDPPDSHHGPLRVRLTGTGDAPGEGVGGRSRAAPAAGGRLAVRDSHLTCAVRAIGDHVKGIPPRWCWAARVGRWGRG